MGTSFLKTKSIAGAALLSVLVVGCGGGGGTSTSTNNANVGGLTQGNLACAAVSGGETLAASGGALIGACEQYEASTVPTRAATAFRTPGINSPLVYNAVTGYSISLPVLSAGATQIAFSDAITPPGGFTSYSFGNYAGKTYQNNVNKDTGSAATAYDYVNTTTTTGTKVIDLNFSRFGMFSRFGDRTLGYYGGWAQGTSVGPLPAAPTVFRGVVVGVIGPSSTNTGPNVAVGYSAEVTLTINTASGTPITALALSNFGFSANGAQVATGSNAAAAVVPIANGGAVSTSALNAGAKSLSASFTTPATAGNSAIAEGVLSGNFYGNSTLDASELVGTLKFRTADGRNAVGAFGVRSGSSIIGTP
jgi:hypothetical protein